MIALQAGNFILVDYLIERAKVSITADISFDGRTLLHYFAQKCERLDLIQILLRLVSDIVCRLTFSHATVCL